jgi:predicted amidohydrolase YtcJ
MPAQIDRAARLRRASCLFAGLALAAGSIAQPALPPQLILFHGRILTVDSHDSIAEGLAIRDGKIIAIGTDRDILRLAGAGTQRIDLHGRTATPGLIDSHAHIADAGVE